MPSAVDDSDRASEAISHVLSLAERSEDGTVVHDLSDPRHAAYLEHVLRLSGKTPERYPALFARVAQRPEPSDEVPTAASAFEDDKTGASMLDDEFVDGQEVDFVAKLEQTGMAKAHGIFTRNKPIRQATVALAVYNDSVGPGALAIGSSDMWLEQTAEVETDDETASPMPSTGTNTGVLTWSVEYVDGTQESLSKATPWAQYASSDPVVTAPVQRPGRCGDCSQPGQCTGDCTAIVIGLARGGRPASDIDYAFWQSSYDNNSLLVPFSGSMSFDYPILPLGRTNPMLKLYLARKEGGINELSIQKTAQYLPYFQIDPADPSGKTLRYSLLPTPNDQGNSINFGPSQWQSDTRTYFTGKVTVQLNTPNGVKLGWATVMSTDKPDRDPSDGVAQIKPLVYVWHCLVAGTQIAIPDGTKAVEDFDAGDVVVCDGYGTTREVLATLAQPHWGTVYTLALASGRSLACSGTHPIMTPMGPLQAGWLGAGADVALPDGGFDTLVEVTQSQQNGDGLFNLWLDPTAPGPTTMVAGGLLVGDYQMQVALVDQASRDPERLRAVVPEHLAQDLESHLEDRAIAA